MNTLSTAPDHAAPPLPLPSASQIGEVSALAGAWQTATGAIAAVQHASDQDLLGRLTVRTGGCVAFHPLCTLKAAEAGLTSILEENAVLRSTVKSLWITHQYNQEFISFLQGRYTEAQFLEIAGGYAIPDGHAPAEEHIVRAARTLGEVLATELSSADVAVLLGIDVLEAERALVGAGRLDVTLTPGGW